MGGGRWGGGGFESGLLCSLGCAGMERDLPASELSPGGSHHCQALLLLFSVVCFEKGILYVIQSIFVLTSLSDPSTSASWVGRTTDMYHNAWLGYLFLKASVLWIICYLVIGYTSYKWKKYLKGKMIPGSTKQNTY